MVEAKGVRVQVRDPALERVELGERVLTQREQHVDLLPAIGKQLRELLPERSVGVVIEEELLELVEDHVEVVPAGRGDRGT